jgi:transaldolase
MESGSSVFPLTQMARSTPTEFWNDSCAIDEMTYAIANGAVGATTNPVIVATVLKKEFTKWEPRIREIMVTRRSCTEDDVAWAIIEDMGAKGAELLLETFKASKGKKGRLSIQANPKYFRDSQKMVEQALRLNALAPNLNIKIPATRAGIDAIEQLTYLGVSTNATVCFTVAQAISVAEATEKALRRREKEGKKVDEMSPMCAIMAGRLDDWLKKVADKKGIITNPGNLEWAGVAVVKKAYVLYKERGYRTRLLVAAYRNHMQWSEFIGGELSMTIPYEWQVRFNASDVAVKARMALPVDSEIVDELSRKFPDFRNAYAEKGLSIADFDNFGATRRTLRQFLKSYDDLVSLIRDSLLPDPDVKGE